MDLQLEQYQTASEISLLIVSDSHGRTDGIASLLEQSGLPDLLIHLGDHQESLEEISLEFDCPVLGVAGNCDHWFPSSELPDQRMVVLAGQRFFLTHGHRYHVKSSLDPLIQAATHLPWQVDLVLFGHTHHLLIRQQVVDDRSIWLLNPGSAFPDRKGPSGIWLEISHGQLRIDPLPDLRRP